MNLLLFKILVRIYYFYKIKENRRRRTRMVKQSVLREVARTIREVFNEKEIIKIA